MLEFIYGFSELSTGSKIFFIMMGIFVILLIAYLVIQSIRHEEF